MFDPEKVDEIIKHVAVRDGTPKFKAVRAAMTDAGLVGSSHNIAAAIISWKERHGLSKPAAKARTSQATLIRSKNARKSVLAAAAGADALVKEALAQMTREATIAADRLAQVEGRLRVLEAENEALRVQTEERLQALLDGSQRFLAQVEERLRVLETDNGVLRAQSEERLRALDEGNQRFLTQLEERLWVVQADNESLTVQGEELLRILEAGDGRLWERVVTSRRKRSAEFWDRVYTAVADIRDQHPNLTRHDIMAMIPGELVQEGKHLDERMDDATFRKSMIRRTAGSSAGR